MWWSSASSVNGCLPDHWHSKTSALTGYEVHGLQGVLPGMTSWLEPEIVPICLRKAVGSHWPLGIVDEWTGLGEQAPLGMSSDFVTVTLCKIPWGQVLLAHYFFNTKMSPCRGCSLQSPATWSRVLVFVFKATAGFNGLFWRVICLLEGKSFSLAWRRCLFFIHLKEKGKRNPKQNQLFCLIYFFKKEQQNSRIMSS
jgi:hypothetical protein